MVGDVKMAVAFMVLSPARAIYFFPLFIIDLGAGARYGGSGRHKRKNKAQPNQRGKLRARHE